MSELRVPEGPAEVASSDGRGRFDLLFEPSGRKVRVPPGVFLFDAAS